MDDFIPTRVSRTKEDAAKEFVSMCYEKPKKKNVKTCTENAENFDTRSHKLSVAQDEQNEVMDERRRQELEMKRIRYEVMKFGMSAFKRTKAEKAHVALALSLGAKPPKRPSVNYKLLKHNRKVSKEAREKRLQHASGLEKSLIKHKVKRAHKKNTDGILGPYGKVNKKLVGAKAKNKTARNI